MLYEYHLNQKGIVADPDDDPDLDEDAAITALLNYVLFLVQVNLGRSFTLGEARRLMKQWCIDGMALPDTLAHMAIKPTVLDEHAAIAALW